ncbi:HAD hydrolase family protein [bacterium]|nr:HAD hydrolase family protein [bacterium]
MPYYIDDPVIQAHLAKISLLIFDIDGVLTDGTTYYNDGGIAFKAFSMRDGFGFVMANYCNIELASITGNVVELVRQRLEPFGITRIKGGHFSKTQFLEEILEETGISAFHTLYVGDDLFDLPVLRLVGLSAAPADAHPEVLEEVKIITRASGGKGVVRELVEGIVKARGMWKQVLEGIEKDPKGGR